MDITSEAADVTAVVRGTEVNVVYRLADLSSDGLAQGNKKAALGSGTTCTNGDAAACCRCRCNSIRASRNPRAYASCSSVTDRGNKTCVGVVTIEAAAAPGGVVAPAVAAPYACCKMNRSRSGVASASRPTSGDASTLPSRTTSCFGLLVAVGTVVEVLVGVKSRVKLVFFRRSSSELSAEGRAVRSIVYT